MVKLLKCERCFHAVLSERNMPKVLQYAYILSLNIQFFKPRDMKLFIYINLAEVSVTPTADK